MLGVYTPGTTFEMYGDDNAKLLKGGKNLYLNFNIHYQTTGKPEKDRSRIAFWFRPEPPKHQLFRVPAAGETHHRRRQGVADRCSGEEGRRHTRGDSSDSAVRENYEVIGITATRSQ